MEIVRFYVNGVPSTVAEEALSPDVRKKLLPEATSLDFKKVPVVDDEGNYVLDYVSTDEHPVIPITYADLVNLLDVDPETGEQSAQLISGQKFRIIDYRCAVNSDVEYARALTEEEHEMRPWDPIPYLDIVVTTETMYELYWDEEQEQYAVVPHITLSEDAVAVDSQYPLFIDSMKSAVADAFPDVYNVKYSLSNDDLYEWSAEDGTGVITWMQDRKGNEAPYDFLQIVFRRYPIVSTALDTASHSISGFACGSNELITVDDTDPHWMRTFPIDEHIVNSSIGCNNKVFACTDQYGHYVLNDVVIMEDSIDTVDTVSNHVIHGQHITCNGKTSDSEISGEDITLDTYSRYTKIVSGNTCLIDGMNNQLQGVQRVCIDGYYNVLNNCATIRFRGDHNCLNNCDTVKAGSHFDRNILNRCNDVYFLAESTDLTSLQDGFRNNVLEYGCSYLKLVCADSSSAAPVQNYTILSGFAGTYSSYLTYNCTKELASRTFLGRNSSKVAKEINVLDLAP